jgi:hypothetical protein
MANATEFLKLIENVEYKKFTDVFMKKYCSYLRSIDVIIEHTFTTSDKLPL